MYVILPSDNCITKNDVKEMVRDNWMPVLSYQFEENGVVETYIPCFSDKHTIDRFIKRNFPNQLMFTACIPKDLLKEMQEQYKFSHLKFPNKITDPHTTLVIETHKYTLKV